MEKEDYQKNLQNTLLTREEVNTLMERPLNEWKLSLRNKLEYQVILSRKLES
jgi:hypothetical protein